MTLADWLKTHPYLEPVARFRARVDAAVHTVGIDAPPIPDWDDYAADFGAGIPLLRSADAAIDLESAGRMIEAVMERLASDPAAGSLAAATAAQSAELRNLRDGARRTVDWLLGDDAWTPSHPGLLRCLGWIATERHLRPLLEAFDGWRNEDRWLRRYCPACGSLPAMAQLVGIDPGRLRLLSCGCCGTRWRFGRTACPFCETDSQRLASVTVDGEEGLRLDYCDTCRAYLKTYNGQGNEAVLLADWTSLQLDLVAHDRGLKRESASLYSLEPVVVSGSRP
jgi:FdhE protein